MASKDSVAQTSISAFLTQLKEVTFALSNRYWFTITTLPNGLGVGAEKIKPLSFMCKSVTIPDSDIDVDTAWFPQGNEPIGKYRKYGDLTATFLLTNGMSEIRLFDNWLGLIFDMNNARVGYKNDYVGKISIEQLDRNGNQKAKWVFTDVFPTKIGSVTMGYEKRNEIMTVDITFSYRFWTLESINEPTEQKA